MWNEECGMWNEEWGMRNEEQGVGSGFNELEKNNIKNGLRFDDVLGSIFQFSTLNSQL